MVDFNNPQLHLDEAAKLKQLQQGKTQAEQQRLADVTCALVHCSASLLNSDSYTTILAASEQRGQQYVAEQTQLKANGLFTYDGIDKFNDAAACYQISDRTTGSVQGVLGSAGATSAITTGCVTIIGCGLGATIAVISLDYSYAGSQQMVSGDVTPRYGEQVLQSLDLSRRRQR